jgi:hypothetical protein
VHRAKSPLRAKAAVVSSPPSKCQHMIEKQNIDSGVEDIEKVDSAFDTQEKSCIVGELVADKDGR